MISLDLLEDRRNSFMLVSPITSYYIRKIISQKRAFLKSVVVANAALEAHALSDINAVIDSLYPDFDEAFAVAQKLESLTSIHQSLMPNKEIYMHNLLTVEQEICWLLGFKYTPKAIPTE